MTATKKWAMYIDGHNFYYAIKNNPEITPIHLAWCDFAALAREIIGNRGSLNGIKYFTAPVEDFGRRGGEQGGERGRQKVWLRAVSTISQLEVVEGFYNGPFHAEPSLRAKYRTEKETDVNIAISLVLDAVRKFYDSAILVTDDYDQIPAVRAASAEFGRHVEVWLPPGQRKGHRWSRLAKNQIVSVLEMRPEMLERTRLPDSIRHPEGDIEAPKMWRLPVSGHTR